MVPLYVLVLLIHAIYCTTACEDGVKIISKETKNPRDLVGNWTTVFLWTGLNKSDRKFEYYDKDRVLRCPEISIEVITPEYVKAKEDECRGVHMPFNWADAKLKLNDPLMDTEGAIFVIGEKENWMMLGCKKMVPVVMKKVSEDYIVIITPDDDMDSPELFAKRTPTVKELECLANNVDVGQGLAGMGLCH